MLHKIIDIKEQRRQISNTLARDIRRNLDRVFHGNVYSDKSIQDYMQELRNEEKKLEFYNILSEVTGGSFIEESRFLYEEDDVRKMLREWKLEDDDIFDKLFTKRYKGYCWLRSQSQNPEPLENILYDLVKKYQANKEIDKLLASASVLKLLNDKLVNTKIKETKKQILEHKKLIIETFIERCQQENILLPKFMRNKDSQAPNAGYSSEAIEFLETLLRFYEKIPLIALNPHGTQIIINDVFLYKKTWQRQHLLEDFPILQTSTDWLLTKYLTGLRIEPQAKTFDLFFKHISPTHVVPILKTEQQENLLARHFDKDDRKSFLDLLHDMQNMHRTALNQYSEKQIEAQKKYMKDFLDQILSNTVQKELARGQEYLEWLNSAQEYKNTLNRLMGINDILYSFNAAEISIIETYKYYFRYLDSNEEIPRNQKLLEQFVLETITTHPQSIPQSVITLLKKYKFTNNSANTFFALYAYFANPRGFQKYRELMTKKRDEARVLKSSNGTAPR